MLGDQRKVRNRSEKGDNDNDDVVDDDDDDDDDDDEGDDDDDYDVWEKCFSHDRSKENQLYA